MCDCGSALSRSCCCTKPAVDWSKPVMIKDRPDTLVRVICTDRIGDNPILYLAKDDVGREVVYSCSLAGKNSTGNGPIVNRPEYRYKNVYEGSGHLAQAHSTMEEAIAIARKAICVVQYIPGDNKSAKIVHTY